MLASISPLGQRARGHSWWRTAVAYLVGSVVAAGAAGAVMGTLGSLAGTSRDTEVVMVAALSAAAWGCAALDGRRRVPGIRRQVDEDWLVAYRDWVHGLGYGLQLGLGVATIVSSASIYLTAMLAVATGSPTWGALIGVGFGLSRSAMLWLVRGVHSPRELGRRMATIERLRPVAERAAIAGQCAVAIGLAGYAVAVR